MAVSLLRKPKSRPKQELPPQKPPRRLRPNRRPRRLPDRMSSAPTSADARDDADLLAMGKHQRPNLKHQASKESFNRVYDAGLVTRWFVGVRYLAFGVFP